MAASVIDWGVGGGGKLLPLKEPLVVGRQSEYVYIVVSLFVIQG